MIMLRSICSIALLDDFPGVADCGPGAAAASRRG